MMITYEKDGVMIIGNAKHEQKIRDFIEESMSEDPDNFDVSRTDDKFVFIETSVSVNVT